MTGRREADDPRLLPGQAAATMLGPVECDLATHLDHPRSVSELRDRRGLPLPALHSIPSVVRSTRFGFSAVSLGSEASPRVFLGPLNERPDGGAGSGERRGLSFCGPPRSSAGVRHDAAALWQPTIRLSVRHQARIQMTL